MIVMVMILLVVVLIFMSMWVMLSSVRLGVKVVLMFVRICRVVIMISGM